MINRDAADAEVASVNETFSAHLICQPAKGTGGHCKGAGRGREWAARWGDGII